MTAEEQVAPNIEAMAAMSAPELRVAWKAFLAKQVAHCPPPKLEEPANITDSTFQAPESIVPIRIYTPEGSGPFPCIVYYHGGGWVFGDLEMYDSLCRAMCVGAEAVLVFVDYRLAPENKFPAAAEDAYAGLCHVKENAQKYNIDTTRIAVAGDSAGGNLTAVVTLMARDRKGPNIKFQCLIYPGCNFNSGAGEKNVLLKYMRDAYLNNEEDMQNIYASPMRADLSGLPAGYLLTCDDDELLDEGRRYCEKLKA
ncbi:hypothetical protein INT43_003034, partial [Umbelopsis isabellina]